MFELMLRYYVHFWTNTLGKSKNPLISPPSCRRPLADFRFHFQTNAICHPHGRALGGWYKAFRPIHLVSGGRFPKQYLFCWAEFIAWRLRRPKREIPIRSSMGRGAWVSIRAWLPTLKWPWWEIVWILPLYFLSCGLNSITAVLLRGWFWGLIFH